MIFILVCLICLSAFLSGSETALFSLPPLSIKTYRASSSKQLRLIARLMERPREVLVTVLMLNVLTNILIQNTTAILFEPFHSLALSIGVPLLLTLVLGELLPKSIALPNCTAMARFCAPIIYRAALILRPVREPLTRATSWISRFLFFFLREPAEITTQELRHVLKQSEKEGVLMPIEARLIDGTLDLQHSLVKEHMRPREEILAYDIQSPIGALYDLFARQEISRVPVYEEHLENILGIVTSRELFFQKEPFDLKALLKKPSYIPESTRAWTCLCTLREKGIDLALIVDEYGSISGLITQEDLVEAVIGEIIDPRDAKDLYTRSGEDVIIASGKLELSVFKEIFHVALQSREHIVTLGGWLIEQLGDIPSAGTKYATDQFLFYVLAADPNRIRRLYVRRLRR
jgi:CBS domain containing-hemolysin-like protein